MISTSQIQGRIEASDTALQRHLIEKEENFRAFFDTMHDMIVVADARGEILLWNRTMDEKLRKTKTTLLGKPIGDLFVPRLMPEAATAISDFPVSKTNPFILPLSVNGEHPVPVEVVAWRGKWNGTDCRFYSLKDISAQQDALNKFRALFDANPSYVCVVELIEGIPILNDANKAFFENTGYSRLEVLGMEFGNLPFLTDRAKAANMIDEVERTGKLADFECAIRTADDKTLNGLLSAVRIDYGRNPMILIAITDITAQKKAEADIRALADIETRLATTTSRFIDIPPEDIDAAVTEAMGEMGEALGVDRVYAFFFDETEECCSNTHEWCAAGTEPQREALQKVPNSLLPWWMEHMRQHKDIVLPRVSELPPEASNEREVLEAQGIQSLLVVPLVWGSKVEGFMGFDSVRTARGWPPSYIAPLKLLAGIVIGALKHKEAETTLKNTEASLRELNADLERRVEQRTEKLQESLTNLKRTQKLLIQQEKLASIGQLAAGVAHEINNPTGYVMSNLHILDDYYRTAAKIIEDYEHLVASMDEIDPAALAQLHRLEKYKHSQDWDFIKNDTPGLLKESIEGAGRIKEIVRGLQTSARAAAAAD